MLGPKSSMFVDVQLELPGDRAVIAAGCDDTGTGQTRPGSVLSFVGQLCGPIPAAEK
jgi:hypothetical protein